MQTHLIAGFGEVGQAVHEVLRPFYTVHAFDRSPDAVTLATLESLEGAVDVLHVCYPCAADSEAFVAQTKEYAEKYLVKGGLVIVHSTVPVGTTALLGKNAVHSPIRGVHPNLVDGVKTFRKYFGGRKAAEAAALFEAAGVPVLATKKAENTEALKLWDTTYYGWNIVFEKAVREFCDQHGLDFDVVYADANDSYNAGYRFLGRPEVARPVLKHVDGPIGGHCVIPNCELLGEVPVAKFILTINDALKGEK